MQIYAKNICLFKKIHHLRTCKTINQNIFCWGTLVSLFQELFNKTMFMHNNYIQQFHNIYIYRERERERESLVFYYM